ncbi:MAG TPA: pyridoxal-phosphate dependent enzyme [Gemmatimonadetes bacterium]|nr:pyridoxal-phosphate dependent enzyme [Gemmatimonadota bacterium]
MDPLVPIPLTAIEEARDRIAGAAIKTPLLPLNLPDAPCEIWLKAECLQLIGSFKIRGAANAMALADQAELQRGVYTASAGNMAQGVAFNAQRRGIPCRVIVPETAPQTKLTAIARLGATAVSVPFDEWWSVIRDHGHPLEKGFFVHPVSDPAVIAGNGTIGLEILEELPDVDAVIVPYGGGGLSCGIGSALKTLRPDIRVFAAEVETASPFAASLAAGEAVEVARTPTFIDGIGGKGVLREIWPLASSLLDGSIVVSVEQVCSAIRILVSHAHLVAEGAGGTSVAAALTGMAGKGKVVAVVSGGNLDPATLKIILEGNIPPLP